MVVITETSGLPQNRHLYLVHGSLSSNQMIEGFPLLVSSKEGPALRTSIRRTLNGNV
jgi:hypothetical protein